VLFCHSHCRISVTRFPLPCTLQAKQAEEEEQTTKENALPAWKRQLLQKRAAGGGGGGEGAVVFGGEGTNRAGAEAVSAVLVKAATNADKRAASKPVMFGSNSSQPKSKLKPALKPKPKREPFAKVQNSSTSSEWF
jgi:hypothetical protein